MRRSRVSEEIKTLKLSDFTEEVFWSFECPYCHEISATYDSPNAYISCEHCGEEMEIEND